MEEQTRLGIVRVALKKDSGLKPGMFAQARLELEKKKYLTIPQEAVLGQSPDYFVFRLDQNIARKQAVKVSARRGERAAISSGLEAGQEVVVKGAGFLRDGDRVTL